ncbi:MAG: carbohydrate-binding domain-containing protein [Eubacteriales bacterium]|nr:carbohydrate-binding domain-containing protein [Eubacteriales bacterium]
MKKILSVILCLSLAASLLIGATSVSADEISVELDGNPIEFDVKPEIIDGRTMVPLRKIFEEIGASVKWDNDTQTVSARKNKKTITLSIDSADLQIDKGDTDEEGNPIYETVTLEVPAQIVSGRTLVPARAISESFGLNVDWDEDNQKVIISSNDEEDESWKENIGSINLDTLTCDGEGIEITDNQIKITQGGDFTVSGTLSDGNITISTKEKVKIRLSGAKITSSNNPCIFVEDADKAYITLSDGTENYLIAENSDDGAIYSKENLEIKGDGSLNIESSAGHGIKASDNLNIENGVISINATSDGIHINDTFKMTGGTVNITSINDGIDCESIVNISAGTINIETNETPIENTQTRTETAEETPRRGMWEMDEADVEFEKSTKGINAEWMMVISGGEINVNSASHAIHCQDEIEITGGKFSLSSKYDKGISAHGNLTISGAGTVIDVTKSTEAIESKNVMTINDGVISVVSTDDALNATGGNSGMMQGGGMRENMGEMQRPENATDANGTQMPMGNKGNRGNRQMQMQVGEIPEGTNIPMNGEIPPMSQNGEFPMRGERPAEPSGQTPDETMMQRPQMDGNMGMSGGNMGGMGRNMKNCLIINGGYLELCGGDDCIDANGNMIINGGIIKATNPTGSFTGNNGVLDADGQTTIGENANIILASSSGNERSLKLTQNTIIVYCENQHTVKEQIIVSDDDGNVVYEYAPEGNFKAVLIASNNIKTGEKYTVTIGDEIFETEITQQNTTIGTQTNGGMGLDRGQRMQ